MNSIKTLATFFGWCAVINFGVLVGALAFFAVAHEWAGRISAKLFGVTNAEAKATFFHVFQHFGIYPLKSIFIRGKAK